MPQPVSIIERLSARGRVHYGRFHCRFLSIGHDHCHLVLEPHLSHREGRDWAIACILVDPTEFNYDWVLVISGDTTHTIIVTLSQEQGLGMGDINLLLAPLNFVNGIEQLLATLKTTVSIQF